MAKARDERARLIDNIGRQIRRLNAREKAGGLTEFQKAGLDRQRQNLNEFREQVKKIGKNDKDALDKAKIDYKSNGNYSTSQKQIDNNTKRLVGSSIAPEGLSDSLPPPEGTGGAGGGTTEGGGGEPDNGDSGGGIGSEIGGSTIMDQFDGLFGDLAKLDGEYIGLYAGEDIKSQVQKILDKINKLKEGNSEEMTPEQMNQLSELERTLESKLSAKGNYTQRNDNGDFVGYGATFNHDDFMRTLDGLTPFDFDVNKWIQENIDLFPDVQSHPGSLSADERFERDNAGILGNYDF